MKNTIWILLCIISLQSAAQLTANRKIGQRWDKAINNAWQGQDSLIFLYNAFGDQIFRFAVKGDNNNWINHYRITTTYDANQNIKTETRENWTNNSWVNLTKYTYDYNAANSRTEIIYQNWITSSNNWRNTGKIENTYNGNQQLTKKESFNWTGSSWQIGTRQLVSYNSTSQVQQKEFSYFNGTLFVLQERLQYQYAFGFISSLIRSIPDSAGTNWEVQSRELNLINGSATPPYNTLRRLQIRDQNNSFWVDSFRTTYTQTNGLLTQSESELYNNNTTSWVSTTRYNFAYNSANQLIEEKKSTYQSNSFVNTTRKVIGYNTNNLNDEIVYYISDGITTWKIDGRDQMTYNINDSLTYRLNQNYFANAYQNNEQYFYHYADVAVGLNDINNLFEQASLYPNPSTDFIQLRTTESLQGAWQATIYDLSGKKVWSQLNTEAIQKTQFPLTTLPQGNYVLQLLEISSGRAQQFRFTKN